MKITLTVLCSKEKKNMNGNKEICNKAGRTVWIFGKESSGNLKERCKEHFERETTGLGN